MANPEQLRGVRRLHLQDEAVRKQHNKGMRALARRIRKREGVYWWTTCAAPGRLKSGKRLHWLCSLETSPSWGTDLTYFVLSEEAYIRQCRRRDVRMHRQGMLRSWFIPDETERHVHNRLMVEKAKAITAEGGTFRWDLVTATDCRRSASTWFGSRMCVEALVNEPCTYYVASDSDLGLEHPEPPKPVQRTRSLKPDYPERKKHRKTKGVQLRDWSQVPVTPAIQQKPKPKRKSRAKQKPAIKPEPVPAAKPRPAPPPPRPAPPPPRPAPPPPPPPPPRQRPPETIPRPIVPDIPDTSWYTRGEPIKPLTTQELLVFYGFIPGYEERVLHNNRVRAEVEFLRRRGVSCYWRKVDSRRNASVWWDTLRVDPDWSNLFTYHRAAKQLAIASVEAHTRMDRAISRAERAEQELKRCRQEVSDLLHEQFDEP